MDSKPRLAKAHSKQVADEYLRLGWSLTATFFDEDLSDEPYEYLFKWEHSSDPIFIDWDAFKREQSL